jgi:hypothetical protein
MKLGFAWYGKDMCIEVVTAVIMKSSVFWDIMLLVRWKTTDVSEKYVASIFKVE